MAVTVEDVRHELGAGTTTAVTATITRSLAQAEVDVDTYIADNELVVGAAAGNVPTEKYDEAVLAAACDAFRLSEAPNGVINQQYDEGSGQVISTPIRISRDPLRSVRPILQLYTIPAIG